MLEYLKVKPCWLQAHSGPDALSEMDPSSPAEVPLQKQVEIAQGRQAERRQLMSRFIEQLVSFLTRRQPMSLPWCWNVSSGASASSGPVHGASSGPIHGAFWRVRPPPARAQSNRLILLINAVLSTPTVGPPSPAPAHFDTLSPTQRLYFPDLLALLLGISKISMLLTGLPWNLLIRLHALGLFAWNSLILFAGYEDSLLLLKNGIISKLICFLLHPMPNVFPVNATEHQAQETVYYYFPLPLPFFYLLIYFCKTLFHWKVFTVPFLF